MTDNEYPSIPVLSTYEYRTTSEDRKRGWCEVFGKRYPLLDGQLIMKFPVMWNNSVPSHVGEDDG